MGYQGDLDLIAQVLQSRESFLAVLERDDVGEERSEVRGHGPPLLALQTEEGAVSDCVALL